MFCQKCGKEMIECPSCKTNFCKNKKCNYTEKKSLIERAFESLDNFHNK